MPALQAFTGSILHVHPVTVPAQAVQVQDLPNVFHVMPIVFYHRTHVTATLPLFGPESSVLPAIAYALRALAQACMNAPVASQD